MKKCFLMTGVFGLLLATVLFVTKPAEAFSADLLGSVWNVSFGGRDLDASRAGLGGFDNWAKWTYTVTAVSSEATNEEGFNHLGFGLTDDFFNLDGVLDSIMITDAGGVDVTSSYLLAFAPGGGGDPLDGMGQYFQFNNEADLVQGLEGDEFNTYMFSTPYAEISDVELGIKQGGGRDYGLISGPGALADFIPPEEPTQEPVVPEPASMLLLGSGLLGMAGARRKKYMK